MVLPSAGRAIHRRRQHVAQVARLIDIVSARKNPMSSQYAVAPEPALQVNVALFPLRVEPGVGVCITPNAPVELNAV